MLAGVVGEEPVTGAEDWDHAQATDRVKRGKSSAGTADNKRRSRLEQGAASEAERDTARACA